MIKNLPTMKETLVQYLGQEDSSGEENGNSFQYSCLENSTEEPGGLWSMGLHKVGQDWVTNTMNTPKVQKKCKILFFLLPFSNFTVQSMQRFSFAKFLSYSFSTCVYFHHFYLSVFPTICRFLIIWLHAVFCEHREGDSRSFQTENKISEILLSE